MEFRAAYDMPEPLTLVYHGLSSSSYHYPLQSLLRKVGGLGKLGDPDISGKLLTLLDYEALATRGTNGRIPVKLKEVEDRVVDIVRQRGVDFDVDDYFKRH